MRQAIAVLALAFAASAAAGTAAKPAKPGAASAPAPTPPSASAPAPASAPVGPPPRPPPAPGLGRISGRVAVAGLAPPRLTVPVTRDIKFCGGNKPDESLEAEKAGGVKNALLWLADGPKASAPAPAPQLELRACTFSPHVQVALPGSDLTLVNADSLFHGPRGSGAAAFELPMPVPGYRAPVALPKEGVVKVGCSLHPWERAWVHVLATRAFVLSANDGAYTLDVPPGRYKLRLWHERLGEREESVEVVAGETTYKDFAIVPKPPEARPGPGDRPPEGPFGPAPG